MIRINIVVRILSFYGGGIMIKLADRSTYEEVVLAGCVVRIRFAETPDPNVMQNVRKVLFESGSSIRKSEEIC